MSTACSPMTVIDSLTTEVGVSSKVMFEVLADQHGHRLRARLEPLGRHRDLVLARRQAAELEGAIGAGGAGLDEARGGVDRP